MSQENKGIRLTRLLLTFMVMVIPLSVEAQSTLTKGDKKAQKQAIKEEQQRQKEALKREKEFIKRFEIDTSRNGGFSSVQHFPSSIFKYIYQEDQANRVTSTIRFYGYKIFGNEYFKGTFLMVEQNYAIYEGVSKIKKGFYIAVKLGVGVIFGLGDSPEEAISDLEITVKEADEIARKRWEEISGY